MKSIIVFLAIFLFTGFAFANDPGERDSLIIETVFAELGDTAVDVRIFATTDDSVHYYNIPISWTSINDSSIYPVDISYYNVLPGWRFLIDTVIFDHLLIRMLGWSSDHIENKLITNNNRAHCWTIHFIVDSLTLPQMVSIDTTNDPISGSLLFGLGGGIISFTPVFTPGAIYYGITSDAGDDSRILPEEIALLQNYPNPFNAQTAIRFILPKSQNLELTVYDLLGRRIEVLIDEYTEAGVHNITFDASDFTSGIYFYRLRAGDAVETKRMTILK